MKRFLSIFSILCAGSSVLAQDFTYSYEPVTENAEDQIIIRDLKKSKVNDLIVGYDFMAKNEAGHFIPKAGIMKLDDTGNPVWSKVVEMENSSKNCTFEIAENAFGNFYLWGLNYEDETAGLQGVLSMINTEGEVIWTKLYDFGDDVATSYSVSKIEVLPSGEIQLLASVFNKVIIIRTDAGGNIIWGKINAAVPDTETGGKFPAFEYLSIPDDGGMCASKSGSFFSLLRYSEEGDLMWNKTYNIGGYTHAKSIKRMPNGNVWVAGFAGFVPHIMEISAEDGEIQWIKTIPGLNMGIPNAGNLTVNENEIIYDLMTTTKNHYIIKLDQEANIVNAMVSKGVSSDYNRIETVGESEYYTYGSLLVDDSEFPFVHEAVINRTSDVFENSCLFDTEETLATEDYPEADYNEVTDASYSYDFTNEEDITIELSDLQIRTKFFCEVFLSDDNGLVQEEISIYPNPTKDVITVNVPENFINSTFTISDLAGREVLTSTVNSNQMNLDLSLLNNGYYIFTVRNGVNQITKKIAVSK